MRFFSSTLGFAFSIMSGIAAFSDAVYNTTTGAEVHVLETFTECDVCPEMVVLPMGEFLMGSTVVEANAARIRFYENQNIDATGVYDLIARSLIGLGIDPDDPEDGLRQLYATGNINREEGPQYFANPFLHEVPQHSVEIDRPIAMGRYEVTRREWAACVEDGGCEIGQSEIPRDEYIGCERSPECFPNPDSRVRFRLPEGPHATDSRAPITGLTYYDMLDYVAWLNEQVGDEVYRIPSEAEWEYAARAGTTTRFAQGDELSLGQANFLVLRRVLVEGEVEWEVDERSPRELLPVDDLDAANAWGLRHMSGNASEFTSSCGNGPHRNLFLSSHYIAADQNTPDCDRAVRGGMYSGNVELARPSRRVAVSSDHWSPSIGFRVLRDFAPMSQSGP